MTRTIKSIIESLPRKPSWVLDAPPYSLSDGEKLTGRLALAVESMKRHMTDEGWQTFAGLGYAGYTIAGRDLPIDETDVAKLISHDYLPPVDPNTGVRPPWSKPGVVALMDKREWEGKTENRPDPERMRFRNVTALKDRPDIFKLTVLKDAHRDNPYHRESADEIGCHAWIIYYNPDIVYCLAPFVRKEHCIRIYHSINADLVPPYQGRGRLGCVISGALHSYYYPLRAMLAKNHKELPLTTVIPHPGYRGQGCMSGKYMQDLSRFQVAICTSSIFGFTLRKLIEATACGCRVLTDLPVDEVLPEIDGNLLRLPTPCSVADVRDILTTEYAHYDPDLQRHYSELAKRYYDYRVAGVRLANQIEVLRRTYPDGR